MDQIFQFIKNLVKVDLVKIDNVISWMHYRVTVTLLITCSLIVSARQYVGDPINCTSSSVHGSMMDTYCWIHSTFTVDKLYKAGLRVGKDILSPGVGLYIEGKDAITYHYYYQWVCFILFFQAMCFYVPRLLWKSWEGGRLRKLVDILGDELVPGDQTVECSKQLADYFVTNLNMHGAYARRYLVCEFFNFFNVVIQMICLNHWFEGKFQLFGLDLYRFAVADPNNRTDPMSRIFPSVTKCSFQKYGPSGTLEHFDSICLLPLNVANECIYVFLWFWFLFVAVISMLNLVYRLAAVISTRIRLRLLIAKCSRSPLSELIAINVRFGFGDWFLLYQLGKNCEPAVFKILVKELSDRLIHSLRAYDDGYNLLPICR